MNDVPADKNEHPPENPSGTNPASPKDTPSDLTADEAIEFVSGTPKTLPLKREASPLFVPVTLPNDEIPQGQESSPGHTPLPESKTGREQEVPFGDADNPGDVTNPGNATSFGEETEPTRQEQTEAQAALLAVEFLPPPEATHHASVTLQLRCTAANASIRYALNAQDVGDDGTLYNPSDKIFLTQSSTVAARAFVGEQAGPLGVARFEIIQPGWQKLEPSEQNDPTTHEEQAEATLEGEWRLVAASVRGRLHAHRAGWREDAFRHGLAHASDGTYSVVVVSDGAGSAQLSRVGSNLLCQRALDFLLATLTSSPPLSDDSKVLIERDLPSLRGILVEAARLALQRLREEATTRNRPLGDFASTLLIVVRREWKGQQLCASLQAGDGGIALWNEDDTLTLLGEADHGEHSSETRFLTSSGMEAELPSRVKFSIRPRLRALAVMTDGVADDFFPEAERFPELFKTVLPLITGDGVSSPGSALLDWIDYEKKGSSDDRTLVICWQAPSNGSRHRFDDQEPQGGSDDDL